MRNAIHKAALAALAVVALVGITGTIHSPLKGVTAVEQFVHPILGLAFWSFLVWKIWKRPGNWGLGVGIFMLLVIVFQTYLWRLALATPNRDGLGIAATTSGFVLYEVPLAVAAVCCILLRWQSPDEPHSIQR